MKKKGLVFLVVVLLMGVLLAVIVGKPLLDKYSYSEEQMDLEEYFGVSGEMAAIVLQDEMVEEQALIRDGKCYFTLDTVHKYMNEVFYADVAENRSPRCPWSGCADNFRRWIADIRKTYASPLKR